ncbi:hypothetical protein BFP72_12370 [Reichenbachiella sp. 5M10]|uniref:hypothetical protein n=1 Tax=Reichenbachiella sp. 5M10 TaxID=1889772 RepID=UPI000C150E4D|nr:hypothetical protein [Reichenbachiella sp. 5M10]PIB36134.1 hypothetical protein BFP72_12370 [Reichenbachiella sp. 5M10]
MQLNKFMKTYAEEVNGNFSEYDPSRSVIVIPLANDRFQAVVAAMDANEQIITLSSKVCIADEKIKFKDLLEQNHATTYGKFVIDNGFLKIESKHKISETSNDTFKTILQEIANLADTWEMNLTGMDIF